ARPPGNAGVFWPFGVKLLCQVILNTLRSAMAPSYTWISSVCANASAGTTNRATEIAASARISIRRKTFIWLRLFYKVYLTPEGKPLECRAGESEGGRAEERASTSSGVPPCLQHTGS